MHVMIYRKSRINDLDVPYGTAYQVNLLPDG